MGDDLKAAFRSLRSAPTFTVVAMFVLALGIGASTAIFSVVDAVVLRGLPFDEHDRLVAVGERRVQSASASPSRDPQALSSAAPQNYMDWAAQQQVFEGLAATAGGAFTLREPGAEPEDLRDRPGAEKAADDEGISIRRVSPDYHEAMRIPLRAGRLFEPCDREGAPNVTIINESAARTYFPGEDPIGQSAHVSGALRTIVGIVGDIYQTSLEIEPRTEAYVPMTQGRVLSGELVIRTSGNPYEVLPVVRAAVLRVLPDVPLRNVRTMEELLASRIAQRKLNMLLLGLFGVLGLVISAAGIYGVMAYIVSQRTREIGVRMALGATQGRVLRMVLGNAMVLIVAGLAIGGVGAWYLSQAAEAFLFRLDSQDPRAFASAILLLCAAALVASVVPAHRAARVDPMVALRAE